jgi:hypothetical protein
MLSYTETESTRYKSCQLVFFMVCGASSSLLLLLLVSPRPPLSSLTHPEPGHKMSRELQQRELCELCEPSRAKPSPQNVTEPARLLTELNEPSRAEPSRPSRKSKSKRAKPSRLVYCPSRAEPSRLDYRTKNQQNTTRSQGRQQRGEKHENVTKAIRRTYEI